MYRIDDSSAVVVKPDYPAGGTPGFFTGCDANAGHAGTICTPEFLNRVQEEIAGVIEGAAMALNPADDKQMFAAIQLLIASAAASEIGQCYLSKSGANLLLSPHDGNRLRINGANAIIPAAGVTLPPAGLTPGTTYYIYAYMAAGVLTLEASTTAYTIQPGTGIPIKSADPTRTLVGMARPGAGPAWVDSATQCFVLSWFNRRPKGISAVATANRTLSSTTAVELHTELRSEFILWADTIPYLAIGYAANPVAQSSINTFLYVDGASTGRSGGTTTSAAQTNGGYVGAPIPGLSEGYHYVTVFGNNAAGSVTTFFPSSTYSVAVIQG